MARPVSRDDVRLNRASWEADSADYQARNASHLGDEHGLAWGIWNVADDRIGALGDVTDARALELGCGACQFGVKVAARGADVIGLDFSENQLHSGRSNIRAVGARMPLVRADAEQLPFADRSFDLVFCDHGATSFTDPHIVVPEVARVLRPGGRFVFNIASPFVWVCWGDDDQPAGRTLRRPYFDLGRTAFEDEAGTSVEWPATYGEWIRVFAASELRIEDLIELRPDSDASTTYTSYAALEWARDYPGEHIWKVRKA
jgi:SAM-dependent methyltransferase